MPASTYGSQNPIDLSAYVTQATNRSQDYFNRGKTAYDWGQSTIPKIEKTGDAITGQALDTSKAFNNYATTDRAQYDETVAPAMRQQMDFARNYTTEGRKTANRAGAMSGVGISFDAAGDMARRQLQSYGVDPSSGRFAGLDAGIAAQRAAATAAAGTKSDRDTEIMGQQFLDNAIARGQVLPGQAANEAGVGLAAGNQAVNTGLATATTGKALQEPSAYEGLSSDLFKEWKNALVQQTQIGMQNNQNNAELALRQQALDQQSSSGLGALLGAGAGILGMIGNFAVPGGGTLGGSLLSGLFSGMKGATGGMVRKYAEGGMVEEELPDYLTPFDPEGDGYDMRQAREAGLASEDVGDPQGRHWPSREPASGLLLKGRRHPTFEMGVEHDRRQGYGLEKQNGRYYTQPFQRFAEGGEVLPEDDDEMVDTMEEVDGGLTPEVSQGDVPNMVPPEASPSGGENIDDVHAQVQVGEFIMPQDVTSWYGEKFMQNLIKKAREEMMGPKAEPEIAPAPQAMAISPPTFQSARG